MNDPERADKKLDRDDTTTPREFGQMKPDGRRFTLGTHSNGGKQLVVRALRDIPGSSIVRGAGYVLVGIQKLPSDGQVTVSLGNAKDASKHYRAPASCFSIDWREE